MIRHFLKNIIIFLKLGNLARSIREYFYRFLDFLGAGIFYILRFLHLLPPIREFDSKLIKKILIIRLDRIGDLILSTPAIRAVRENFPEAEIFLLIREYTKDLVIHNPNINKLLIYGKDKIDNDYDLSIALHPGFRQNFMIFISGARYRVGCTGWGGGFFLTHKLVDDRQTRVRHVVESVLEVVRSIGCSTDNKAIEVSVTDEGERFVEQFLQENQIKSDERVIIIHPGARQECIRWKKEGFAEVGDRLIREVKARVILIGDDQERKLVEEIAFLMQEKPLFALGLELTQAVSLIKKSSLFIGNASGPMHIAAALNVPVVAIFGVVNPLDSYQEWGPWGEGHIVVSKNLQCPDCHPSDCKTFDCLGLISTDEVFIACKEQLKKLKKNKYG